MVSNNKLIWLTDTPNSAGVISTRIRFTPGSDQFNFGDGSKIPKEARALYRARLDLRRAFPDPFSTLPQKNFKHWIVQEFGTLDMVHKTGNAAARTIPGRSSVRRIREALMRYCGDQNYRQQIHKTMKSILKYEGLGALLRYVVNRR